MDFLTTNDLIFLTIISILFISVIVIFATKKIRNFFGDFFRNVNKKLDKKFEHFFGETIIGSGIWFVGNLYFAITMDSMFYTIIFSIFAVGTLFLFVGNIVLKLKK